MKDINVTDEWDLYQKGIDFKNRIGLYSMVEENNRYFQGDQWYGLADDGLPKPVFNVIKPVIRYKISTIMQNDTKIVYSAGNASDPEYPQLQDVASKLTKYAESLWEKLKMDFNNENVLKDGAITGDGIIYFYYDEEKKQICAEIVDSTNIYPGNVNDPDIQSQDEYIILTFRRSVTSVRREAINEGMSEEEAENITSDEDTMEQAGDMSKMELDTDTMCIVAMKLWKDPDTKTVHCKKSVKNAVIVEDKDTMYKLYPIAMMNWETVKNSFHGVSDVTGLIPNQLYINKIAAMIMISTMFTAFPKMVYDSTMVDNPDNEIGVAIGVKTGGQGNIKNLIDYISPAAISGDAFNMFERTITLTKELMGAGDGALGSIDPTKASGRSILAVMEQSATPLESIRRRFYNYIEDVALIWADMWRVHAQYEGGMQITYTDNDGEQASETISGDVFDRLMLQTKIDVGPSSRWNERALQETLDNLLQGGYIPFEEYVELMPESSGLPKEKLKEFIEQQKQMQLPPPPPQMSDEEMDAFLDSLPPEVQQQALENPQILEQLIAQQFNR